MPRPRGHYWYQIAVFVILMGIWMIFSGLFDAFHLSLGVVSSLLVTWFSSGLLFQDREKSAGVRFREFIRIPGYVAWLLYEIVIANVHVLRLALLPGGPNEVEPQIVRFTTVLQSEFARWVLAQSITLTPGTVTIKVDDDEYFVHAISAKAAAGLRGTMEQRVQQIFEPGERGGEVRP
jgi:multicomponent Na+:H+ antiporter subunit E